MEDGYPEKVPSAPPADPEDVSVPLGSEQPPSYETSGPRSDAPPSYQSLYGQIKETKAQSSSPVSFLGSLVCLLLNTMFMTIFMAILLAIPISMIVIGAIYKDDCPVQYLIPIYLITTGVVYIVKSVIDLKVRAQRSRLPPEEQKEFQPGTAENSLSRLLSLFLFVFFICGNVWIYGIYAPNTSDPTMVETYCNPTLYYFAFWVTTAGYILMALACCCCCTAACFACVAN